MVACAHCNKTSMAVTTLKVGKKAPAFTLLDQNGDKVSLSQFIGQWVFLYFYPKDDTPGCTKEACAISDDYSSFGKLDAVVFGVSTDSVQSHKKFETKYKLPFRLLADTEKKVVERYGVWGEKSLYGRKYMGTMRMSFIIDPKGKIARIYHKVRPAEHAAEVLTDLRELRKGTV